jgi:hypothetical protein
MTTTERQELLVKAVLRIIASSPLKEQLAIISNVLIRSGLEHTETFRSNGEEITTLQEVFEVYLKERNKNGETLATAMIYQGLNTLEWLVKDKEKL